MNSEIIQEIRIIRIKEVIYRTGFSRPKIYSMLNENSKGYDPDFPRQINLGKRAVGWMSDEVTNWIIKQVNNTRKDETISGEEDA